MDLEQESRHLVEVTHGRSGKTFRIYLSPYEMNKCSSDNLFLEEITEKYFQLMEKGLVGSVEEDGSDEPLEVEDTQMMESSNNNAEQRYHWPRPAVLLLLAELEKRKQAMQNPHKKRVFSTSISKILQDHGYPVTWEICERKWRGMQSMYKKIVNKENMPATGHCHWEYFESMQNILASDPSYNTPATVAAGTSASLTIQPEACGAQNVSEKGTCKKKKPDNTQTAITEIQESIRELKTEMRESNRIQLERNQIMDKVASVLEKLVNT